jgi:hypothetical protein
MTCSEVRGGNGRTSGVQEKTLLSGRDQTASAIDGVDRHRDGVDAGVDEQLGVFRMD